MTGCSDQQAKIEQLDVEDIYSYPESKNYALEILSLTIDGEAVGIIGPLTLEDDVNRCSLRPYDT